MRERYDSEAFFASMEAPRAQPTIPERVFFAGRERPPPEAPLATRAAATPLRFALVLFLVGWAGILFQASILQQVVIGAPVFEELAKAGPPLVAIALLRLRSLWLRLPLAWASGTGFGVMEHFVTYPDEPLGLFVDRVLFHALAPGVSVLVYGAIEWLPDPRARWASTLPATLLHWINNFAALVLGLGGIFVAIPEEPIALGVSALVIGAMIAITLAGIVARGAFERRVRGVLETMAPRVGLTRTKEEDERDDGRAAG